MIKITLFFGLSQFSYYLYTKFSPYRTIYMIELIEKYFPALSERQKEQYASLGVLYPEWNAKINVISRKDIEHLYEHHILHSLGIACALRFSPQSTIVDVGTGGGFPGIPLAIMFPECHFHLIDRIGKKVRVASEIAASIGLDNVTFRHAGIEEEKQKFDFAVSRAVMPLPDLVKLVRKNISSTQRNAMANGLLCLKGGELEGEVAPLRKRTLLFDLNTYFKEEFFETKKVVYVQI